MMQTVMLVVFMYSNFQFATGLLRRGSIPYALGQRRALTMLINNQLKMSSSSALPRKTLTKQVQTGSVNLYTAPELDVKKSIFIGYASHCSSWNAAQEMIQYVKTELHPKARHVCFAVVCGGSTNTDGDQVLTTTERSSDDGEPTGTAGLPILSAIQGEELVDCLCIVVRYFGGIKLGAGGLIRAYGAAARQVLRSSPTEILIPTVSMTVKVAPQYIGSLYDALSRMNSSSSAEDYGMDGSLSVTVVCEANVVNQLKERLRDATKGNVTFLNSSNSSSSGK